MTASRQPILERAAQLAPQEFDSIPIIDLSLPEEETVAAIREACLVQGFFYIKNHGVPEPVVERTFEHARAFFALPEADKLGLHMSKSNAYKGYMGLLSENVDPENRGDLHEALDFGFEPKGPFVPATPDDKGLIGGNLWPDEKTIGEGKLEGFRADVLDYYHGIYNLGRETLFPLFALALDLPRDHFTSRTERGTCAASRLLYYPPQEGVVDDRVMGIGAHSDYECFTILRQQMGVQALQVLNRKGQWIDAPPIPGTFVVNIADALQRATNDVFVSTRHRAINRSGTARYSIPFFFGEDYEQIISPYPSCISADRPRRYDDISAGDYVKGRLDDTYSVSAAPEGGAPAPTATTA